MSCMNSFTTPDGNWLSRRCCSTFYCRWQNHWGKFWNNASTRAFSPSVPTALKQTNLWLRSDQGWKNDTYKTACDNEWAYVGPIITGEWYFLWSSRRRFQKTVGVTLKSPRLKVWSTPKILKLYGSQQNLSTSNSYRLVHNMAMGSGAQVTC